MLVVMNRPALRIAAVTLALAWSLAGCGKKEKAETSKESAAPVEAAPPRIVINMIDAHGGMAAWRSSPPVSFEDELTVPGAPSTISRVTVDQRPCRAYIDYPGSDMSLAWNGKEAWSTNWTQPYPPRFLALLNYRFLTLPWLTMDPGVHLSQPENATMWGDSLQYASVKMTFAPETRDNPNDYYRLYIDRKTKQLKACAYALTYRAMLPDSVDTMPERLLVYEDFQTVNGLLVPTKYTIYSGPGQPIASCVIRDWSFKRPFDEGRMTRPAEAAIDSTTP